VALGHCDAHYHDGQSKIATAPPALCRLPRAGLPVAVLAGARCLKTWQHLAQAAALHGRAIEITIDPHPGPLGLLPDTIQINADSEDTLHAFSKKLGLPCPQIPPAWTLVNWCGTIPEYEEKLHYRVPKELNWTRYDFCINSHSFVRMHSEGLPRYTRYLNPTTGLPMHVFYRGDLGAEVDLNWGRYLLLRAAKANVTAYDDKKYRVFVPLKIPLPSVIARSICLCSGRPPVCTAGTSFVPGCECTDWLMFEGVPPQIALAALSKVGQAPVILNKYSAHKS
jgi:hypothetical protein